MSKYRVAIIGCGRRSVPHIQAYRQIEDAEIVACCAPSAQRRDSLANEFNLHPYQNAEEMINKEKPDMVHLITWPDTHVELMSLISDLNVPLCTVEKPIATGVADWLALCKLAQKTNTKFAVCHQFRWQRHLIKCQDALRSGKLGIVMFLDISSRMNIAGQGTHTLNYGRSLIDDSEVMQVTGNAFGWEAKDLGHPAPAATEAYLTFNNGVRALWTSGAISPHSGNPDVVREHVRVAAFSDRGRVNYEEFGNWEIVSQENTENGTFGNMNIWQQNNLEAQANFHKAMFNWLENDAAAPGTSLDHSLHEWKVVLALYTSSLERCPINMESFTPKPDLFNELSKIFAV